MSTIAEVLMRNEKCLLTSLLVSYQIFTPTNHPITNRTTTASTSAYAINSFWQFLTDSLESSMKIYPFRKLGLILICPKVDIFVILYSLYEWAHWDQFSPYSSLIVISSFYRLTTLLIQGQSILT